MFGVFTGAILSFYIGDFLFANKLSLDFMAFPFWSRACLVAAVIALLLRYIIGSAVHLNLMYVPKVTQDFEEVEVRDAAGKRIPKLIVREKKSPASKSLCRLFFDIVVLVVFGILAVSTIHASDLQAFMVFAACFIFAGFPWGVFAFFFRPEHREIAKRWMVIDVIQGAIAVALIYVLWLGWIGNFTMPAFLAVFYVFCLQIDLAVVSRPPLGKQKHNADAAKQAAA